MGELLSRAWRDVLQQLRKRRDLSIAATDQDNADVAEKLKGSLISATLTQIMTEKRNLSSSRSTALPRRLENYRKRFLSLRQVVVRGRAVGQSARRPRRSSPSSPSPPARALLRKAGMIVGK